VREGGEGGLVHQQASPGVRYLGTKWGQYLRAPDIYFELLDLAPDRFVPIRQIAWVRYGIKSGANEFFYLRDITDVAVERASGSDRELRRQYGVSVRDTEHIRICLAGDGSAHLVEAHYLKPAVFNLMEISGLTIDLSALKKRVLLVSQPRQRLHGTHVLRYIKWGEQQGYHERTTCATRATEEREWYDLRPGEPGKMFWSMSHKYRHIVAQNTDGLPCDHNLFHITPNDTADPEGLALAAILNSTITVLFKHQYGRSNVGESTLKTEVVDVRMMKIVDPRGLSGNIRQRLSHALERLAQREIGYVQDEIEQPDRRALDDAVLEALGVRSPAKRAEILTDVYRYLGRWYRDNREVEVRTVRARHGRHRRRPTARDIAQEIWEGVDRSDIRRFPEDFHGPVRQFDTIDLLSPRIEIGTALMADGGLLASGQVRVGDRVYDLGSRERADYVKCLGLAGYLGQARVPSDTELSERAVTEYMHYRQRLERTFTLLAQERTQDQRLAHQIVDELMRLARNHASS